MYTIEDFRIEFESERVHVMYTFHNFNHGIK